MEKRQELALILLADAVASELENTHSSLLKKVVRPQTDIVENVKRISARFTFGDNITPTLENTVTKVKSITLQPNIYTCNINLSIVPLNLGQTAEGRCIEAFSYTPNLGDSICSEYAINIINPIE